MHTTLRSHDTFAEIGSLSGRIIAPSMQTAGSNSTFFSFVDLRTGQTEEFTIPLTLAHSWAEYPKSPSLGVVPESGGRHFCLVDPLQKKVLKSLVTRDSSTILGGHAAFSPDGKLLFLSQFSEKNGSGSVSVRSADTWQEIRQISSYGQFPHELYVRDGGRTVLIANLGSDPQNKTEDAVNFTSVDVATGSNLKSQIIRPDKKRVRVTAKQLPEEFWAEASYFLQVGDAIAKKNRKLGLVLHPHSQRISIWRVQDRYEFVRVLDFSPLQVVAFCWVGEKSHLAVALSDNSLRFIRKVDWMEDHIASPARALKSSTHIFSFGEEE